MQIENLQAQEAVKELPKVKMDVDPAASLLKNTGQEKLQDVLKAEKPLVDDSNIGLKEDEATLDAEKVKELVEAFNNFMVAFDQKFKFRIHEETNQVWVRIMDTETDRILREIPAKDTLKLASKIKEFVGLLVDKLA